MSNPYIQTIMSSSGSQAFDAELEYILGAEGDADLFKDEESESEDSEEEHVDEGEDSEEESEEDDGGDENAALRARMKKTKTKKVKFMSRSKKKKKKGVKRKYTKREKRLIAKMKKQISSAKSKYKKTKKKFWKRRHMKRVNNLKFRIKKLRSRARKRYLNSKGSLNLEAYSPFGIKPKAEIAAMSPADKKSYLMKKSIASGTFLGAAATFLYALYKRDRGTVHILENGMEMTKGEYLDYEDSNYEAARISETYKPEWLEVLKVDPKISGSIFGGVTVAGSLLANNKLKKENT
jgi:hypothetical protein